MKAFIKSKRKRINQATKAYRYVTKRHRDIEILLYGAIADAEDELGDDLEHIKFLDFLSTFDGTDVLYVLPHYMMKLLQMDALDPEKNRDANIFDYYERLTECSSDVLEKILSFRDNYKTGLMKVCVQLTGDSRDREVADVYDTIPNAFELAMHGDYQTLEFYVGQPSLFLDSDRNLLDDMIVDKKKRTVSACVYAPVIWMKRVS